MDHDRAQQGGSLLVRGGRYLDVVAGEWRDGDIRILDGRVWGVGSQPPSTRCLWTARTSSSSLQIR